MIAGWYNPMWVSVRTRSTVAAALVMACGLVIASGVLLFALYRSLERTAQRAAGDRTEQISEQLQTDAPRELDRSMLVTDSQIGAVQIVDSTGVVLRPPTVPLRRRWRAWH